MSVALHRVLAALDRIFDHALLLRSVARPLIADMAPLLLFADADGKAVERIGRGAGAQQKQRRGKSKTKLHGFVDPNRYA
jgi:hypothetical protein